MAPRRVLLVCAFFSAVLLASAQSGPSPITASSVTYWLDSSASPTAFSPAGEGTQSDITPFIQVGFTSSIALAATDTVTFVLTGFTGPAVSNLGGASAFETSAPISADYAKLTATSCAWVLTDKQLTLVLGAAVPAATAFEVTLLPASGLILPAGGLGANDGRLEVFYSKGGTVDYESSIVTTSDPVSYSSTGNPPNVDLKFYPGVGGSASQIIVAFVPDTSSPIYPGTTLDLTLTGFTGPDVASLALTTSCTSVDPSCSRMDNAYVSAAESSWTLADTRLRLTFSSYEQDVMLLITIAASNGIVLPAAGITQNQATITAAVLGNLEGDYFNAISGGALTTDNMGGAVSVAVANAAGALSSTALTFEDNSGAEGDLAIGGTTPTGFGIAFTSSVAFTAAETEIRVVLDGFTGTVSSTTELSITDPGSVFDGNGCSWTLADKTLVLQANADSPAGAHSIIVANVGGNTVGLPRIKLPSTLGANAATNTIELTNNAAGNTAAPAAIATSSAVTAGTILSNPYLTFSATANNAATSIQLNFASSVELAIDATVVVVLGSFAGPAVTAGNMNAHFTTTPASGFAAGEATWSLTDKKLSLITDTAIAANQAVTVTIASGAGIVLPGSGAANPRNMGIYVTTNAAGQHAYQDISIGGSVLTSTFVDAGENAGPGTVTGLSIGFTTDADQGRIMNGAKIDMVLTDFGGADVAAGQMTSDQIVAWSDNTMALDYKQASWTLSTKTLTFYAANDVGVSEDVAIYVSRGLGITLPTAAGATAGTIAVSENANGLYASAAIGTMPTTVASTATMSAASLAYAPAQNNVVTVIAATFTMDTARSAGAALTIQLPGFTGPNIFLGDMDNTMFNPAADVTHASSRWSLTAKVLQLILTNAALADASTTVSVTTASEIVLPAYLTADQTGITMSISGNTNGDAFLGTVESPALEPHGFIRSPILTFSPPCGGKAVDVTIGFSFTSILAVGAQVDVSLGGFTGANVAAGSLTALTSSTAGTWSTTESTWTLADETLLLVVATQLAAGADATVTLGAASGITTPASLVSSGGNTALAVLSNPQGSISDTGVTYNFAHLPLYTCGTFTNHQIAYTAPATSGAVNAMTITFTFDKTLGVDTSFDIFLPGFGGPDDTDLSGGQLAGTLAPALSLAECTWTLSTTTLHLEAAGSPSIAGAEKTLIIATTSGITIPSNVGAITTMTMEVTGNSQVGASNGNSVSAYSLATAVGLATTGTATLTSLTYMPAAGSAVTEVRFGFTYDKRLDVDATIDLTLAGFTGSDASSFTSTQVTGTPASTFTHTGSSWTLSGTTLSIAVGTQLAAATAATFSVDRSVGITLPATLTADQATLKMAVSNNDFAGNVYTSAAVLESDQVVAAGTLSATSLIYTVSAASPATAERATQIVVGFTYNKALADASYLGVTLPAFTGADKTAGQITSAQITGAEIDAATSTWTEADSYLKLVIEASSDIAANTAVTATVLSGAGITLPAGVVITPVTSATETQDCDVTLEMNGNNANGNTDAEDNVITAGSGDAGASAVAGGVTIDYGMMPGTSSVVTLTATSGLTAGTSRAYLTAADACDTATSDGTHTATTTGDDAGIDTPALLMTAGTEANTYTIMVDADTSLTAGASPAPVPATYRVCIDRDGGATTNSWEDIGLSVPCSSILSNAQPDVILPAASQAFTLTSSAANGYGTTPTYYLTQGLCDLDVSDGQHTAYASDHASYGTDTAHASFTGVASAGSWTGTAAGNVLDQGTFKICVDMDGSGTAASWIDSGGSIYLQTLVTAVSSEYVFPLASQVVSLTSFSTTSVTTATTAYITAAATGCDTATSDGSHTADATSSGAVPFAGSDPATTAWTFTVDATGLATGVYTICLDGDGSGSAQSWASSSFTIAVLGLSNVAIAPSAGQTLTIANAPTNIGGAAFGSRKYYVTSGDCDTTGNNAHAASTGDAANTDTAAAAFTSGWTMTLAGDTLLQGTYKVCFDEDGGTATLKWMDMGVSFQLQKFVTAVSSASGAYLFAAADQTITLTSNAAPSALTDDTSTVYLTSGTCDAASSGSVAAVAGTSTASAVVDDNDDSVATTWIAHIDASGLTAGTYRVCVDADGTASTYNFADTALTMTIVDSDTLWVWGYNNGANSISLSSSATSWRGYLTQGTCSSATNGAHTAYGASDALYGTDTGAVALTAAGFAAADYSTLVPGAYSICIDIDGTTATLGFVDSGLTVNVLTISPLAIPSLASQTVSIQGATGVAADMSGLKVYLTAGTSCDMVQRDGTHVAVANADSAAYSPSASDDPEVYTFSVNANSGFAALDEYIICSSDFNFFDTDEWTDDSSRGDRSWQPTGAALCIQSHVSSSSPAAIAGNAAQTVTIVATDATAAGTAKVYLQEDSSTCSSSSSTSVSAVAGSSTAALDVVAASGTDTFTFEVDASSGLDRGTYRICFHLGTGSWFDSGLTVNIDATDATTITAVEPAGCHAGETCSVTLVGTTASGDKLLWANSDTECTADATVALMTSGADTTFSANSAGTDKTVTVPAQSTAGAYKLCYRASGNTDVVQQTGIVLTVYESDPSIITAISPIWADAGTATVFTVTCPTCVVTDSIALATDCSSASTFTALVDASDATLVDLSHSFTLAAAGTYSVCVRQDGNTDSAPVAVLVVHVTASDPYFVDVIYPTAITVSTAAEIALRGSAAAVAGDTAIFAADCLSSNTTALLGDNDFYTALTAGVNQTSSFTVDAVGSYELCYSQNGNTDAAKQTAITLTVHEATDSNVITASSLTTFSTRETFTVALTGTALEGDKAKWATSCADLATADGVWDQTGWTAVTAGVDQATTFPALKAASVANADPATYYLCYQYKDSVDGVAQTGVTASGTDSSPRQVTAISPQAVSAGMVVSVTVTGVISVNDTAVWTTGSCAAATPNANTLSVGSNLVNTVNLTAGDYVLCYRAAGNSDSVAQDDIVLQVTDSNPNAVTAVSLSEATAGNVTLTYTGTFAAGDTYYWEELDTPCAAASATNVATAGSGVVMAYTFVGAATYKLCVQSNGQSDAASQGDVQIVISAATPANIIQSTVPATLDYTAGTADLTFTGSSTASVGDKIIVKKDAIGCDALTTADWAAATVLSSTTGFSVTLDQPSDASGGGMHVFCMQLAASIDSVQQGASFQVTFPDTNSSASVVTGTINLQGMACDDFNTPEVLDGFVSALVASVDSEYVTSNDILVHNCSETTTSTISAARRLQTTAALDFQIDLASADSGNALATDAFEDELQNIAYDIATMSVATFKTNFISAVTASLGENAPIVTQMESDLSVEVGDLAIIGEDGSSVNTLAVTTSAATTNGVAVLALMLAAVLAM